MDFLSQLKISASNNGVSTGTEWLSSRNEKIESYSPVDGKLIASVSTVNKKNYEAVLQKAQEAFLRWRLACTKTWRYRTPNWRSAKRK